MADVYCIVNKTIRLSDRTQKTILNEPLEYDNNLAHAFRVTVVNDEGDEDLSEFDCYGSFTPNGENTITPIPGTTSGNVAQVILPGACYRFPGRYKFTMNLTKTGGASRTVLIVEGHSERNQTATIEAPTEVINVTQVITEASAVADRCQTLYESLSGFSTATVQEAQTYLNE